MSEFYYYAAAYWRGRPEPAEECAQRAATFFRLLSACHSDYARWYEKARSRKKALQLGFEPTRETFVRFFSEKRYQAGNNGFSFEAWTGHLDNQGGMVLLGCGEGGERVTNLVQLYFPSEPPGWDRLVTLPVVTGAMRAMVLAWEPEWAVVTPGGFRDQLSETGLPGTFVGWLTYYSQQWGEVPPLPEPVRVELVEDKGTLVVLTPERLDETNASHLALGRRVQEVLEEGGLLRRVGERL